MTTKIIDREPTREMIGSVQDTLIHLGVTLSDFEARTVIRAMFESAPEINHWVSVSERLPTKDGQFLCAEDDGDLAAWYYEVNTKFDPSVKFWWDESIMKIPRPE